MNVAIMLIEQKMQETKRPTQESNDHTEEQTRSRGVPSKKLNFSGQIFKNHYECWREELTSDWKSACLANSRP